MELVGCFNVIFFYVLLVYKTLQFVPTYQEQ